MTPEADDNPHQAVEVLRGFVAGPGFGAQRALKVTRDCAGDDQRIFAGVIPVKHLGTCDDCGFSPSSQFWCCKRIAAENAIFFPGAGPLERQAFVLGQPTPSASDSALGTFPISAVVRRRP